MNDRDAGEALLICLSAPFELVLQRSYPSALAPGPIDALQQALKDETPNNAPSKRRRMICLMAAPVDQCSHYSYLETVSGDLPSGNESRRGRRGSVSICAERCGSLATAIWMQHDTRSPKSFGGDTGMTAMVFHVSIVRTQFCDAPCSSDRSMSIPFSGSGARKRLTMS